MRYFTRMTRTTLSLIVGGTLTLAAVLLGGRGLFVARGGATDGADSVWYHESDVTQLGTTGRPQLVEFFHPG